MCLPPLSHPPLSLRPSLRPSLPHYVPPSPSLTLSPSHPPPLSLPLSSSPSLSLSLALPDPSPPPLPLSLPLPPPSLSHCPVSRETISLSTHCPGLVDAYQILLVLWCLHKVHNQPHHIATFPCALHAQVDLLLSLPAVDLATVSDPLVVPF